MPTPSIKSFDKSISLLRLLLEEESAVEMKALSREIDAPVSTLYRYLSSLTRAGLLFRKERGGYLPNPAFLKELAKFDANAILVDCVRPHLARLGAELAATVHFGVLEDDMVSYIVKEGRGQDRLFTREGQQLEAYCSAIGKVLLADLPKPRLDAYLSGGVFPALTNHTLTTPREIRAELKRVRSRGYGVDDREVDETLFCLAVPVRDGFGCMLGAISASSRSQAFIGQGRTATLASLRACAHQIGARFGAAA